MTQQSSYLSQGNLRLGDETMEVDYAMLTFYNDTNIFVTLFYGRAVSGLY